MVELSRRQRAALSAVETLLRNNRRAPTRQEIADALGVRINAAQKLLKTLATKGVIRLDRGKARGIEVLVPSDASNLKGLPIVGSIAAGAPISAASTVEDWRNIPADLFHPPADFLVRVRGESMLDAGILDGDLVAVQRSSSAAHGEIVVALLVDPATGDGKVTLKRLRKSGGSISLEPMNATGEHLPIVLTGGDEMDQESVHPIVFGIFVGLIRDRGRSK